MRANYVMADEFNAVVEGLQADILKVKESFELLSGQVRFVIEMAAKQKKEANGLREMLHAAIAIQSQQTAFIKELCNRFNELEGGGTEGDEWKEGLDSA